MEASFVPAIPNKLFGRKQQGIIKSIERPKRRGIQPLKDSTCFYERKRNYPVDQPSREKV
jgi:hypothetical protein